MNNHSVGIYTTSFRSYLKIKLTFLLNGFSVDFIINQNRHLSAIKNLSIKPSKYPLAFGIDLHIDDSKGVEMEGEKYGFQTVIIDGNVEDWVGLVKNKLN